MDKVKKYIRDVLFDERDAASERMEYFKSSNKEEEYNAAKNYRNRIMKAIREQREKKQKHNEVQPQMADGEIPNQGS